MFTYSSPPVPPCSLSHRCSFSEGFFCSFFFIAKLELTIKKLNNNNICRWFVPGVLMKTRARPSVLFYLRYESVGRYYTSSGRHKLQLHQLSADLSKTWSKIWKMHENRKTPALPQVYLG